MGYRHITKEEEDFIIANDSSMSILEMCNALSRSKGTIDKTRRRLGLRKDFHTPWTQDEITLIENNPSLSGAELQELMPTRTISSITSARWQRGWSMEKTCFMCEQTFTHQQSNTKICGECNPSGVRDSSNPMVRYAHYKEGADIRGLPFELTGPDFWSFWQKSCTYCGSDIDTIGLDRIDATRGYTTDNVTPCCSRCNEMKMTDTLDTWVSHMKKILNHLEKNNG